MNIVFAGTPDFSVPALQALLDSPHDVVAVYTQPDRPSGRGRKTSASPVKQLALQNGLAVYQPVSLKSAEAQQALAALQPDLMVVIAYGLILPAAVLTLPRLGCINVHASLLPRWRGAAPIQRAILAGDHETGVCLMQMDAGLDTGPVFASARCPIEADDSGSRLHDRLAQQGAQLLSDNLAAIERGELAAVPQDDALACYASKLEKAEARIDWTMAADEIMRRIRAFNAWPVAETRYGDRQLRIWDARVIACAADALPGTVLVADKEGVEVACGKDCLQILKLQLPGGRAVSAGEFVNAHAIAGMRLDDAS
jgi:methionyl-tRNA formyltransferase